MVTGENLQTYALSKITLKKKTRKEIQKKEEKNVKLFASFLLFKGIMFARNKKKVEQVTCYAFSKILPRKKSVFVNKI